MGYQKRRKTLAEKIVLGNRKFIDELVEAEAIEFYVIACGERENDDFVKSAVATAGDSDAILLTVAHIIHNIAEQEEVPESELITRVMAFLNQGKAE